MKSYEMEVARWRPLLGFDFISVPRDSDSLRDEAARYLVEMAGDLGEEATPRAAQEHLEGIYDRDGEVLLPGLRSDDEWLTSFGVITMYPAFRDSLLFSAEREKVLFVRDLYIAPRARSPRTLIQAVRLVLNIARDHSYPAVAWASRRRGVYDRFATATCVYELEV